MKNIPIIMDVTTTLAADGAVTLNDESRLRNPCRRGMLLDEIRIITPAGTYSAYVKFRFRSWDITNDWVRACYLGPRYSNLVTNAESWHTNWRLPKPMYVPPGEYVIPSIWSPAPLSGKFVIAYLGRELPDDEPIPSEVTLPFIGSYRALPGTDGELYDDESKSNHLCNPFQEPLFVYRLMGGVGALGRAFIDAVTFRELLKVTMMDSQGETIVRDPTPFMHLFPQRGPGWLVKAVLNPGEYWRVKMHAEASTMPDTPEVAMFGYHNVQMTRL